MMEQILVKGQNRLEGEVVIGGAKNAALPILAASVMTKQEVVIENIPNISDINDLIDAIKDMGAKVNRISDNSVSIDASGITQLDIDSDYVRKIRASYYLIGALLGREKYVKVALPGGCNIGTRPIDQHIKGFEILGAKVKIEHGMIEAKADKLEGKHIYFDVVSVGATINVMFAAVYAKGVTILENVAKEPHVVDVANFLNSMGAKIKGAGTDVIKIEGVTSLRSTTYSIIPDQIEAGTFMIASAITNGDVVVKNVILKHMEAISAKLIEMGADITQKDDEIRVRVTKKLNGTNIKTLPYPGYPTDMQSQMTTLLSVCNGTSIVTENIFENRFKFVDELIKMGANIQVEGNVAIVTGVDALTGAYVVSSDLRAGASLVLAGLRAEGETVVDKVEYIRRGYENFEFKLQKLGANIRVIDDVKSKLLVM